MRHLFRNTGYSFRSCELYKGYNHAGTARQRHVLSEIGNECKGYINRRIHQKHVAIMKAHTKVVWSFETHIADQIPNLVKAVDKFS